MPQNPNIRPEFTVHLLNATGIKNAEAIAEVFSSVLDVMDKILPAASHEKSLMITHLQAASFFAKRAMAMDPSNQKTEG